MRIHLTGASGTGTTTLGRALAEFRGCPHLDSDHYFWLPTSPPYREKRPPKQRDELLLRDLSAAPHVVESGSLVSWSGEIATLFDLVVFLWVPPAIRLDRLRRRETAELGRVDAAFMEWAAGYDDRAFQGRNIELHERWLEGLSCPVLRLVGDLPHAERLARVVRAL